MCPLALNDHAKIKPGIVDNVSKHCCFMICTNEKSGLDHSTQTTGAFLIIDSVVRLLEDTAANTARLAGKAAPLRSKVTGEEKLVSRNGGKPYTVIQLEC